MILANWYTMVPNYRTVNLSTVDDYSHLSWGISRAAVNPLRSSFLATLMSSCDTIMDTVYLERPGTA